SIYNETTGQNAQHYSPEPGDVLYAVIDPGQADNMVAYQWFTEEGAIAGANSSTFTVRGADAGKMLGVYVGPKTSSESFGYIGEVATTTKPVAELIPLQLALTIDTPKAGKIPETYVTYKYEDKEYHTNILWGTTDWTPAELDRYGHFLPGEEYVAAMQQAGYSADVIEAYGALGGQPSLDYRYTVFGHVYEGLDIVKAISAVKTDDYNRPKKDIEVYSVTVSIYQQGE
ncbi:MAG: peptidylprolyl isomerase, partial [Oscillospiraceae bacterium]|nr:peptidylprolyl isomerase [Oscillospiraceae bacterium]